MYNNNLEPNTEYNSAQLFGYSLIVNGIKTKIYIFNPHNDFTNEPKTIQIPLLHLYRTQVN